MRTNAKKWLALLLAAVMALGLLTACGSSQNSGGQTGQQTNGQQQPSGNGGQSADGDQASDAQQAPEAETPQSTLVSQGFLPVDYAEGFTIELFENGCRMIRESEAESQVLVVPEGTEVPADLEEDVQVLQLPVHSIYTTIPAAYPMKDGGTSTALVAMADAIGAAGRVKYVSMEADSWYVQSIVDQLNSGYTQYVGKYSAPDFELIGAGDAQLCLMRDYDEDIFSRLKALGLPVLLETSSSENSLPGRLEWIKCLGVVFGMEDEANAYFEDQMAQIAELEAMEPTGLVVGLGGVSPSSGKFYSRKSGDYQADQIRAGGGAYNLEDVEPGVGGSLEMTPEDFYVRFKDCDVLIWYFSAESVSEIEETYPLIADFKAYQNNRIYVQSDDFIQSADDPACIIRDIRTILTSDDPEASTDHIVKLN